MADQKISAMDPAGALTGAEVVPVVQGGANARTTLSDVVAYGNALVTLSTLGASVNGITLIGHTFAQMRADLDLEAGTDFYSIAAADAAISSGASAAVSTHVGLADPHTQYLLESAVSANGLTLIGHTFAQMRADLDLEVGVDVQAYDADTAKTDVAQSWTANQTFGGSDANVLTIYRSGAAAKLRFIESTNNNAWGLRNNANVLTLDYNGTDYVTFGASGAARFSYDDTTKFNRASTAYLLELQIGGTARGYVGADASKSFILYNSGGTENFSINNSSGNAAFESSVVAGLTLRPGSFTVAGLPAGTAGDLAYASNGRKNGEGGGAGTGVLVFKDGSAWRACDTGATVAA